MFSNKYALVQNRSFHVLAMVGNKFKPVFNVSETKTAEGEEKGGKTNVLPLKPGHLANKQTMDLGDFGFLGF